MRDRETHLRRESCQSRTSFSSEISDAEAGCGGVVAGEEPVFALPSGLMDPGCARLAVLHSRIWLKADASGSWMEGAWSTEAPPLQKPHHPEIYIWLWTRTAPWLLISQVLCLCCAFFLGAEGVRDARKTCIASCQKTF